MARGDRAQGVGIGLAGRSKGQPDDLGKCPPASPRRLPQHELSEELLDGDPLASEAQQQLAGRCQDAVGPNGLRGRLSSSFHPPSRAGSLIWFATESIRLFPLRDPGRYRSQGFLKIL
jgi:hypothetical protein